MIEIASQNNVNKVSLMDLTPESFTKIIEFLTEEDLISITNEGCLRGISQIFWKLAKTRLNFIRYINKSDTIYSLVFCQKSHLKTHFSRLPILALSQNSHIFYQFSDKFNFMVKQCSKNVQSGIRDQFEQKLQKLFLDPEQPMPYLFRQAGPRTKSNFQNFLLGKSTDPNENELWQENVFKILKQSLKNKQQDTTFLLSLRHNPTAMQLRQYPFQITFSNRESKLTNNELHNLIVSLLAMTELHLSAIAQYFSTIEDPFELMSEINIKYNQFITSLISIQTNLGYLFNVYDQLVSEMNNKRFSEKFSFWKCALVMWIKKMNVYNNKCQKLFAPLLQESIRFQMQEILQMQQFLSVRQKWRNAMKLNNKLEQSGLDRQSPFYEQTSDYFSIGVLVTSYYNYITDLSINQCSVYACGFSKQQLGPIFCEVQPLIIQIQESFKKILQTIQINKEQVSLFEQLIQRKIVIYSMFVDPRVLSAIIRLYISQNLLLNDQIEHIRRVDSSIQNYIKIYVLKKDFMQNRKPETLYNLAFARPKIIEQSSTAENSIQTEKSIELEYYESDSEMDIEENQFETQMINQLSKSIN